MLLHLARRGRKLLDARRIDGERRGTGRGAIERDPAFDLAALQFRGNALAQRGFEAAQFVG